MAGFYFYEKQSLFYDTICEQNGFVFQHFNHAASNGKATLSFLALVLHKALLQQADQRSVIIHDLE